MGLFDFLKKKELSLKNEFNGVDILKMSNGIIMLDKIYSIGELAYIKAGLKLTLAVTSEKEDMHETLNKTITLVEKAAEKVPNVEIEKPMLSSILGTVGSIKHLDIENISYWSNFLSLKTSAFYFIFNEIDKEIDSPKINKQVKNTLLGMLEYEITTTPPEMVYYIEMLRGLSHYLSGEHRQMKQSLKCLMNAVQVKIILNGLAQDRSKFYSFLENRNISESMMKSALNIGW